MILQCKLQAQAGRCTPMASCSADAMQGCADGKPCFHATEDDESPISELETHQPNHRIMTPSTNREELCPAKSLACRPVIVSKRIAKKDRHPVKVSH